MTHQFKSKFNETLQDLSFQPGMTPTSIFTAMSRAAKFNIGVDVVSRQVRLNGVLNFNEKILLNELAAIVKDITGDRYFSGTEQPQDYDPDFLWFNKESSVLNHLTLKTIHIGIDRSQPGEIFILPSDRFDIFIRFKSLSLDGTDSRCEDWESIMTRLDRVAPSVGFLNALNKSRNK